jgi:hypothetical protein
MLGDDLEAWLAKALMAHVSRLCRHRRVDRAAPSTTHRATSSQVGSSSS